MNNEQDIADVMSQIINFQLSFRKSGKSIIQQIALEEALIRGQSYTYAYVDASGNPQMEHVVVHPDRMVQRGNSAAHFYDGQLYLRLATTEKIPEFQLPPPYEKWVFVSSKPYYQSTLVRFLPDKLFPEGMEKIHAGTILDYVMMLYNIY